MVLQGKTTLTYFVHFQNQRWQPFNSNLYGFLPFETTFLNNFFLYYALSLKDFYEHRHWVTNFLRHLFVPYALLNRITLSMTLHVQM